MSLAAQKAVNRLMAPPSAAAMRAMSEQALEAEAFIQTELVNVEFEIEAGPEFNSLVSDTSMWIRKAIARHSRDSIIQYLGNDSTKYSVFVDGKLNAPLTGRLGQPFPKEIIARDVVASLEQLRDQLRKAFALIMNHLRQVVPSSFNPKYTTGRYQTSAFSARFFTILQNGKEVTNIDWSRIGFESNISIYSKARHASPIESIHAGRLLAGAAVAASRVEGVAVSFAYRNPTKMKQETVVSKRTGKAYRPLAVPVIEIGSISSNVIPRIVNVSRNLSYRKETETGSQNLIYGRRILPESRRTNPALYPKSRKRK